MNIQQNNPAIRTEDTLIWWTMEKDLTTPLTYAEMFGAAITTAMDHVTGQGF